MNNNYKDKYVAVADLYDSYVKTNLDEDFWIKECKKENEVLELTCGTGRVAIPLAKAGIKVTAVDISKEFVDTLKTKVKKEKLKIDVHEADMRDFSFNRKFPLIVIPFQSIQELNNPKDHEACFKNVNKHLENNGRFIVTTHNFQQLVDLDIPKFMGEFPNPKTKNNVVFLMSRKYDLKTHVGTAYQFYEEYDKKGSLVSKKLFKNSYYVFDEKEFESLVKKTGFVISKMYGDYSHSKFVKNSPFRIYELVKKK